MRGPSGNQRERATRKFDWRGTFDLHDQDPRDDDRAQIP
jgi:hypothetical protein